MDMTRWLLTSMMLAQDRLPPLPEGPQIYMFGEMHGLAENEELARQYVIALHNRGLRDVAIEEDNGYEPAAQAFVDGRTDRLPPELCLRAAPLRMIREFNNGKRQGDRVRVHLVDVDSPATGIAAHAAALRRRGVAVPEGADAVTELAAKTRNLRVRGELRTLAFSMKALAQGFSVGTGVSKGSSYLEEREQAITENLRDVIRGARGRPVLAVYGADHVSRSKRRDGGPNRDAPFAPAALRLTESGVRVYSIASFPLSGRWRWRAGLEGALWSAEDGELDGVPWDRVFRGERWLFVEKKGHSVKLPSQDLTRMDVDAYVVIWEATPMVDTCGQERR